MGIKRFLRVTTLPARLGLRTGYGNLIGMGIGDILTFGTDGSCLRNPDGPTGWAYICANGEYSYGGRAAGTNQIGELMAILTVLRDYPHQDVEIQSDSAYAIGCSSTWKVGWQRAGYVRKTGPIANLDLIREIHALIDSRVGTVRFVKVKAHLRDETVHPLNVRADELAGRGARAAATAGSAIETGIWPVGAPEPTPVERAPHRPASPQPAPRDSGPRDPATRDAPSTPAGVESPARRGAESELAETGFLF